MLRPLGSQEASGRAERLLREFGTLAGALAAEECAQARVLGGNAPPARFLTAVRRAMLYASHIELGELPLIANTDVLVDHLRVTMAYLAVEEFRVMFLNSRNRLLRDEVMWRGSVNHVPIYPRVIMKRAIEVDATALILAHNHPSGDPVPSEEDIAQTRRIVAAGSLLEIAVHDHLIIGRTGWVSMRIEGLI